MSDGTTRPAPAPRARPVIVRLTALPALAVATVILLALVTVVELGGSHEPTAALPPEVAAPKEVFREVCPGAVLSSDAPALAPDEALARLPERASPAVIDLLWSDERHRDPLCEIVVEPTAPEPARVDVLRRLAGSDDPRDRTRALALARELIRADDAPPLGEGALLLVARSVVSAEGSLADVDLLEVAPGESRQARRNAELARDRMISRLGGEGGR